MSSFRGIAIVTKALLEVTQKAVSEAMSGVRVKVGPPRPPVPGEIEVNLYLYRLEANAAMRNADLPRTPWGKPDHPPPPGQRLSVPTAAVDLHYLVAFSGEVHLATEMLLGKVLTTIHARPVISYADVVNYALANDALPLIDDAPIPAQDEPIRLTLEYPTLEEITKLWSIFFQIAHRPSLFLRVSGVLLSTGTPAVGRPMHYVHVGGLES